MVLVSYKNRDFNSSLVFNYILFGNKKYTLTPTQTELNKDLTMPHLKKMFPTYLYS